MYDLDDDWPQVEAWGLDDFFREMRARVLELEDAFHAGDLEDLVGDDGLVDALGEDIVDTYRRLVDLPPAREDALRKETVHALLDQAREEIFNIRQWCDARVVHSAPVTRVPRDGGDSVESLAISSIGARLGSGREEYMRLDQVISARFWGIGFNFSDVDVTNHVARQIASRTASRLARDLRHLRKVLCRFRPVDDVEHLRLVPKPEERGFEQLMLDILNEERRCARPAPLSEDFLEKTDLRVRYPGLDRRRGGRVQVTQITDVERHREKTSKIRKLSQFTILSPLTLARFINRQVHIDEDEMRTLHHFDLDSFWRCLPNQPTDIDQLAYTIKRILLDPLRSPRRNPRGPVEAVPWALKQIVRIYVRSDTFRATRELRESENQGRRR